jgi:HSP20 family protein
MSMIRRKEDPTMNQQLGMRDEMNRLFDTFFQGALSPRDGDWRTSYLPLIDVHETASEIVVTAELPGIRPEDVDVNLTGSLLTIKGEKKEDVDSKGKNWHRIERSYGTFQRTFQLPETIDPERTKATSDHGVLRIQIAKTEAARPRNIKVDVVKG